MIASISQSKIVEIFCMLCIFTRKTHCAFWNVVHCVSLHSVACAVCLVIVRKRMSAFCIVEAIVQIPHAPSRFFV